MSATNTSNAGGEFDRVWAIAQATALPGLELSITDGKPSIKVKGNSLAG
jgi:hypothetical protein